MEQNNRREDEVLEIISKLVKLTKTIEQTAGLSCTFNLFNRGKKINNENFISIGGQENCDVFYIKDSEDVRFFQYLTNEEKKERKIKMLNEELKKLINLNNNE